MRILATLFVLYTIHSYGQKEYAKEIVSELCSEKYLGRGYTNNSDKKAAQYIADKFKEHGVIPVSDTYFQKFKLDINTFPTNVKVSFDNQELITGKDFIIDPNSGSANGRYELFIIDSTIIHARHLENLLKQKANENKNRICIVINAGAEKDPDKLLKYRELPFKYANDFPVIKVNNEKLTWGTGRNQYKFPIIEMKADFIYNKSSVTIEIQNEFKKGYETQNVVAFVKGTKSNSGKKIKVFTAHYDHLGQMGSTAYIPGANDNASGISMLINLAKHYGENPPKYDMVFIAFGAEEAGLIGSHYFVQNPLIELNKIKLLINLDLLGTGDDGIAVVNATVYPKQFKKLLKINKKNEYFPRVKRRGAAANSDHYFFTKAGVPCFFIYTTGGIAAYHDINDKAETLPFTDYNDVFNLLVEMMKKIK